MSRLEDQHGSVVQSVDRALAILELLADQGDSSVTDIAKALSIHKSTASRLLATLEHRDLVERATPRAGYRLSYGVLHLTGAVMAEMDLVHFARPICERLSDETEETVNIAVLRRGEVINIDQVIGPSAVVSINWTGRRTPLCCTSTGKVLLAHQAQDRQRELLQAPIEQFTEHTITDPVKLQAQLLEIRQRGYGYTLEELELGMNAVAAPIYAHHGGVVAAVSVSGPAYRLPAERIPVLGDLTMRAAGDISARLGFHAARASSAGG